MPLMTQMAAYKNCSVPLCDSTTFKHPNKLFIPVPRCPKLRRNWLQLARKNPATASNRLYYCEDHFNLPIDMENYMQYKIMGSIKFIRMKPDSLPCKFDCQSDILKETRLMTHQEAAKIFSNAAMAPPATWKTVCKENKASDVPPAFYENKATQIRPQSDNKLVQVCLRPKFRSKAVQTVDTFEEIDISPIINKTDSSIATSSYKIKATYGEPCTPENLNESLISLHEKLGEHSGLLNRKKKYNPKTDFKNGTLNENALVNLLNATWNLLQHHKRTRENMKSNAKEMRTLAANNHVLKLSIAYLKNDIEKQHNELKQCLAECKKLADNAPAKSRDALELKTKLQQTVSQISAIEHGEQPDKVRRVGILKPRTAAVKKHNKFIVIETVSNEASDTPSTLSMARKETLASEATIEAGNDCFEVPFIKQDINTEGLEAAIPCSYQNVSVKEEPRTRESPPTWINVFDPSIVKEETEVS